MSLTQKEFDEIKKLSDTIETAMYELDSALRDTDKRLYERWKAYGKQVTNEFVSECTLADVIESLESQICEEEDDEEFENEFHRIEKEETCNECGNEIKTFVHSCNSTVTEVVGCPKCDDQCGFCK